ncbi:MAG: hypothetical protein WCT40_03710 [Candidatus Magasanikbacteria bacterium]|jgi:ribulose-phosphate 3-epimerase
MKIVPAILVNSFAEFARQAQRLIGVTDLAQIDVMDGEFVASKSFAEIEKINELNLPLEWELHLMVAHPLAELDRWAEVKNIQRVIFHIESSDDPTTVIAKIRGACKQVGIAIKPETPLSALTPYLDQIDLVLFMTVHPGQQGAPFLPEMGDKIKEFIRLIDFSTPLRSACLPPACPVGRVGKAQNDKSYPLIAVDGGVSKKNIALVQSWGVDIAGAGSALSRATDIRVAWKKLQSALK